jgi:hypothetical protein
LKTPLKVLVAVSAAMLIWATLTPVGGSVTSSADAAVFAAPAANGSAPFKRR